MAFTGIEPEGVRLLADRLVATADLADELALGIGRTVFDSGLASQTPAMMRGLAGELVQTGALLHGRADTAQRMVVDLALLSSLVNIARAVAIDPASCPLGPQTAVGFASPCDPVESIKIYTVAAGAYVPVLGYAGPKLDVAYILRVEHLRSGRLRVTRIEEAALGIASSAGMDGEIHIGKSTTTSGASAKAWIQLLVAHGTTYEIGASELDEFIATDLLDMVTRRFAIPFSPRLGAGLFKGAAKKVVGFVDHLPLWKLHDAVTALRKRLNWIEARTAEPVHRRRVDGRRQRRCGRWPRWGHSGGWWIAEEDPLKGKVGISLTGRAVFGVEHRATEQTFYFDIRSRSPHRSRTACSGSTCPSSPGSRRRSAWYAMR